MDSVTEHTSGAAAAASRPTLAPAGAWADLPRFSAPHRPTAEQLEGGRCIWLNDNQIDLTGPHRVWLTRTVNEIVAPDGLGAVGQISVDYDPGFERVVFHHVRILREGVTRVFDPTPAMQVFQRERDLERARFDGRLTAHFVIPDLRLGDIVDVAWSVTGTHPVLGDRFAAEWVFEWGCWVGETRVRLLTREDRPLTLLSWLNPPAETRRSLPGGALERVWRSRSTAPVGREPDTPAWSRSLSAVTCADVLTWAEVVETFRPLYPLDGPLPESLEAEAVRIETAAATPAARAMAALRLVQGALRYQAVTVGAGGFTPNPLDSIWATRSGDCKDASLLLVRLLRRLGLDACPALVNTAIGPILADEPPALAVFDHCIVRLRIDGASFWLDPTNFPQGGRLETTFQPRWGWALPLMSGGELEPMGEGPVTDLGRVEEEYVFGATPEAPARLTIRSENRAWRADSVRRQLSGGKAALEESYRDFYARRYGGATVVAPMEVEDDLDGNVLTTVERYDIARPWEAVGDSQVRFQTYDDLFLPNLHTPRTEGRRHPIDLGLPRRQAHDIVLRLGKDIAHTGWNETIPGPGVELTTVHQTLDDVGSSRLRRTLAVSRRLVPAGEAPALFDLRDKAARTGVVLTMAVENGAFVDPAPPPAPRKAKSEGINWWLYLLVFLGLSGLVRACAAVLDGAGGG